MLLQTRYYRSGLTLRPKSRSPARGESVVVLKLSIASMNLFERHSNCLFEEVTLSPALLLFFTLDKPRRQSLNNTVQVEVDTNGDDE